MKKSLSLILGIFAVLLVMTSSCKKTGNFEIEKGKYELSGSLDSGEKVNMVMKLTSKGKIRGQYVIGSKEAKDFEGSIFDKDKVTLYVGDNDDPTVTWNLTAESEDDDITLSGTMTDAKKGKVYKVELSSDPLLLSKTAKSESSAKADDDEPATEAKELSTHKLKTTYKSGGTGALVAPQYGFDYKPSYLFNGNKSKCWALDYYSIDYAGNDATTVYAKVDGDVLEKVVVYNGYQKSSDIYHKNTRPRHVTVSVYSPSSGSESIFYDGYLSDKMGSQTLNGSPQPLESGDLVKFYVDPEDVYWGNKYTDICLSQVDYYGK